MYNYFISLIRPLTFFKFNFTGNQLVIDKFSDVLVVQSLALGIDRLKPRIIELLKEILESKGFKIRGVYERSDAKVRKQDYYACFYRYRGLKRI